MLKKVFIFLTEFNLKCQAEFSLFNNSKQKALLLVTLY